MQDQRKTKKELIDELNVLRRQVSKLEKVPEVNLAVEKDFLEISVNALQDTLFVFDPETGKAIRWNEAFNRLSGYNDDEIRSLKAPDSYYSEEDLRKAANIIDTVSREGIGIGELSLITKDGKRVPTEYTASIIKDKAGKPKYIIAIGRDISGRKQTEEALRTQALLIDQAYDSMISTDLDGNVTSWNKGAERMFGYTAREALGKHISFIYPEDQYEFLELEVIEPLKQKGEHEIEVQLQTKSGEIFHALLALSMLKATDGTVIGMLGSTMDITQRKQTEDALRASESFNRAVIDRSPLGVSVRSRTGKLFHYNKAWKRIWLKSDEVIQEDMTRERSELNFTETDDYLGQWQTMVKDIYEQGGYLYIPEAAHVNKKEGELWVSQYFYAIKNSQGEVDRVVILTEDITERKLAEEELRRYECIVSSSHDMMALLDNNYIYLATNEAYLESFGLSNSEVVGHTVAEVFGQKFFNEIIKPNAEKCLAGNDVRYQEWFDFPIKGKRFMDVSYFPYKGTDNEIKGFAVNTKDITDRKQAEKALRESEEQFRDLAEMLPEATFETDQNHNLTFANRRAFELFGYAEEDLARGLNGLDFIAFEDRERAKTNMASRLKGEDPGTVEYQAIKKDGSTFPILFHANSIMKEGELIGFRGIIVDITERKQAEQALRESEEKYRAIVAAFDGQILICSQDYNIEFMNQHYIDRLGYDATGQPCYKAIHNRDEKCLNCVGDEVFQGITIKREIRGNTDNRWYYVVNTPVYHVDGSVSKLSLQLDITDRKRAEEALREERDRAQKYLDIAGVVFVALNHEGKVTLINKKGCQILGYDEHEIVGNNWFDNFLPENMREPVKGVYKKLMAGDQENVEYYENYVLAKDGQQKLIAWHNTILMDENGITTGTLSSGEDITQRKLAEEALRERQEMISALIETSKDWIWSIDIEGKHTYCNPAIETILGYRPNEMIGKGSFDYIHPDDREKIASRLPEWIKEKRGWSNLLIRWRHQDGSWRYLESNSVPILNIRGEMIGFRGVDRDITERIKAEEALRDNEEKYRKLVSTSSDAIMVFDAGTRQFVEVNSACETLYGYSHDEFLKIHVDEVTAELDKTNEFIERVLKDELDNVILRYHKKKDGSIFPVEIAAGKFAQGDRTLICGFVRDITQRKEHEQRLRESQERFHRLAEASFEGIVISEKGLVLDANNQMAEMLGCDLKELIGGSVIEFVAPESREYVMENIKKGFEGPYEHLAIKKDGTTFPVEIQAKSIPFDGRIVRVTAIHDLTLRKKAEEALLSTQAVLKESQKMASIGGWSIDLMTNEAIWTDEVFRIHEIMTGEMPSMDKSLEFYSPEVRSLIQEAFNELMQNGESYDLELPFITAKGRRLWIRTMGKADFRDGKIVKASGTIQDITERKRAEEAMKESEEKLRKILDSSPDAITVTDLEGKIIDCNPATGFIHGYTRDELIGANVLDIISPSYKGLLQGYILKIIEGESAGKIECVLLKKDGSEFPADFSASIINDSAGKPQFMMGITRDLTEQKKLEAQFLQSQKMESVGRLAGGVAHDFNNLLTAIIGHSEFLEMGLKPEDPLMNDIKVIQQSSERAADLTGQLLAFSRKQTLRPKIVDLNGIINGMSNMLKRIIGEDVDFSVVQAKNLWKVKVDPGQMEQVIVNLAVNARDAMPSGGILSIETRNIEVDEVFWQTDSEISPGNYVLLSVKDTGSGMSPEVKANIFEPFFTTKGLGKGTGLGLSTVYGIVRQSSGHIRVHSAPAVGTTFDIYLPTIEGDIEIIEKTADFKEAPTGTETILVVEDDESVRRIAVESLKRQGYTVIESITGGDALLACEQMKRPADLVITDVVMPNISGPEFIDRLKQIWPEFKKLYISGYTEHAVIDNTPLTPHLQKPFRPKSLVLKVREVLDD